MLCVCLDPPPDPRRVPVGAPLSPGDDRHQDRPLLAAVRLEGVVRATGVAL